jgi:hypothetical protein
MTWVEHINREVVKGKKILNVMGCLSGMEWGTDRMALKMIYIAVLRSSMDYGSIAYVSAAQTSLKKLDVFRPKP